MICAGISKAFAEACVKPDRARNRNQAPRVMPPSTNTMKAFRSPRFTVLFNTTPATAWFASNLIRSAS